MQIHRHAGGSGGFSAGNVTTLLSNLGGLGGAVTNGGLLAGSSIGFDTTNSSGLFTVADSIANSTGSGGGAIGLVKLGSGTLALTGANSYSGGNTINAGTLMLGSSTSLGSSAYAGPSGPIGINAGWLNLNGFSTTVGTLSGSSGGVITTNTVEGTATLTTFVTGTSLYAGTIVDNGAGKIAMVKSGDGTLALSAANTFTGTTTIQAGTLELRGGSLAGPIVNNATLAFTNTLGVATVLSGQVSGSGNMFVNGGGAVRLTNTTNSFSGTTTVNYGTLVVTDPRTLGTGTAPI
ncbi:MAG: autotransporter-associated beta strand repeat-containing protein, partial [Planctomycetia bacterium]|nr:autotransporter-associated beta strand repeat-containing protein [Planctomycetia bacterium]